MGGWILITVPEKQKQSQSIGNGGGIGVGTGGCAVLYLYPLPVVLFYFYFYFYLFERASERAYIPFLFIYFTYLTYPRTYPLTCLAYLLTFFHFHFDIYFRGLDLTRLT